VTKCGADTAVLVPVGDWQRLQQSARTHPKGTAPRGRAARKNPFA